MEKPNYQIRWSDFRIKKGIDDYDLRNGVGKYADESKVKDEFKVELTSALLTGYNVGLFMGAVILVAKGLELLTNP